MTETRSWGLQRKVTARLWAHEIYPIHSHHGRSKGICRVVLGWNAREIMELLRSSADPLLCTCIYHFTSCRFSFANLYCVVVYEPCMFVPHKWTKSWWLATANYWAIARKFDNINNWICEGQPCWICIIKWQRLMNSANAKCKSH